MLHAGMFAAMNYLGLNHMVVLQQLLFGDINWPIYVAFFLLGSIVRPYTLTLMVLAPFSLNVVDETPKVVITNPRFTDLRDSVAIPE